MATIVALVTLLILTMFAGACFTMSTNAKARKAQRTHTARRAHQQRIAQAMHDAQMAEHAAYMSQRDKTAYPFHA